MAKITKNQFSAILASSVHDIKNTLSMLINTLDDFSQQFSPKDGKKYEQIAYLQHQASRVNAELMRILSLYKMEHNQYPLNISQQDVTDFLEEQVAKFSTLAEHHNITFSIDCEQDLIWYFDYDLIVGVINDVVGNAIRYTKKNIIFHAREEDDYLILRVDDDGDGFPDAMLNVEKEHKTGVDFESGSTGLGLYFAAIVANIHVNKKRIGKIALDNEGPNGGGRFAIYLP